MIDASRSAFGVAATGKEMEREEGRLGVVQKCTFCSDPIDFGLANGVTPGIDERATPACVNACIAEALHFGDLDDDGSNVSRIVREQPTFRMHEELGTLPGFHYVSGRWPVGDAGEAAHAGELRSKGAAPTHQEHWDWTAAGNFICGGAGTGLFMAAAVAGGQAALLPFGALALAIVALGLLLVLLKIGRPERFIYVLVKPQRSWMSREAWIAGALFPLAALAIWFQALPLVVAAAVAALLFLLSQAMILYGAKGIPAWRLPHVVPLIVVTGLPEGLGIFLIAGAVLAPAAPPADAAAAVAIALAALRTAIWWLYFDALRSAGAPARSLEVLSGLSPFLLLAGLAAPALLVALGFTAGSAGQIPVALAGALILGSGAAMKFVLVTRAAFNQGFALPQAPAAGGKVAATGVKPGWLPPSGAERAQPSAGVSSGA